ncbi:MULTISPECIES: methyltransferase [unclassified Roseitalea]|uniref:class I SAM-dependent DNA methyltransferase n=1 Tax=unclassified Roseitalea TaxID=2639107 RepID=UPI00273FC095|nr:MULTISPECIES: methyltransferase [unclassified Roseitalea]
MADALAQAYEAALRHEKAGRIDQAARLYRRCLALDAEDRCGAAMRLASMGAAQAPDKAPDAYVATLFDQHAERFDDILTGALGYAVPMQAAQWLADNAPGPYRRMLDLGCGTGLAGLMLMEMCAHATGVDISPEMVDKADERAAYDALYVNEAVHFLTEWARGDDREHAPFDLIVATDVLPYFGALEPLFDGVGANAAADARLVFSAETLPGLDHESAAWAITPHQRFAHGPHYLQAMCARAGFASIEHLAPITVRSEQGAPIAGYLVVAARGR